MQKIYDITPPEATQELSPTTFVPKVVGGKKRFLVPLIFLILILGAAFFFVESKAEIEIWPRTKLLDFKTPVIIDETIEAPNFSECLIPGRIIEIEKTVAEKFSSSEIVTKETKAEGIIRVYNNYSLYPQAFVAETRFVSDSGKVFRTPEKIVVPGKKLENGKWSLGSVDIRVIAAEPGPGYDILPSTFSIPGLKGSPLFTFFYAKSFEPMKGGSKTQVYRVAEKDIRKAKEILSEKALQDAKKALINELSEDRTLIQELISSEIVEVSPLAEVGQELDSFVVQVKVKSKGLTFQKSGLNQFAQAYILANIESDYEIVPQSLDIKYSFLHEKGESEELSLDLSAEIYLKIDFESLKKQILGKEPLEIRRDVFKNFSEINDVETKLRPFWARKAPLDIKNIEINLNFE